MRNLWQVAVYEYKRNVFKKSFIITLLSVPLLIAFSVGFGLFIESRQNNPLPVGYVDQAGVLNSALITPEILSDWDDQYDEPVSMIGFQSEEAARMALEEDQIQAYFVVPESYLMARRVSVVYIQEPGENAWLQFYDFLRLNILSGYPPEIVTRAAFGIDFIVRSMDGRREVPAASGPTFGLLMPLFVSMSFLFLLLMSSGYTMSAVADEKENRTMEVLVTTISPFQLIGGKILGITAISLTLLCSWVGVIALGIFIGRLVGVNWLNDLSMDWRSVVSVVAIAIPAYLLVSALMTAIGAMVTTTQEGQSVSTVFVVLHLIPLYISWSFLNEPHNSQAVLLSLLPFTSLMTVAFRNLFTIVPTWQVAISVLIQTLCACVAIWLASRAFRLGMLHYGQRMAFRRLFARG